MIDVISLIFLGGIIIVEIILVEKFDGAMAVLNLVRTVLIATIPLVYLIREEPIGEDIWVRIVVLAYSLVRAVPLIALLIKGGKEK